MRQVFNHGCLVLCASYRPQAKHTVFRCLSAAWGRTLCAHRGNRIGGHKNRSFLYGTVRPRVISECGNMNNPRPLAYEACLKKTCADSASLDAMESASWHRKPSKSKDQKLSEHFTWHCSVHPTGQQKEQCSAGFASGRSTISRYGVDCQSMHAFAPFAGAWLSAPVQQDDQKTGKGARAHPLL